MLDEEVAATMTACRDDEEVAQVLATSRGCQICAERCSGLDPVRPCQRHRRRLPVPELLNVPSRKLTLAPYRPAVHDNRVEYAPARRRYPSIQPQRDPRPTAT